MTQPAKTEGSNNNLRTIRLEYLREIVDTVGTLNKDGEYEIKSTKNCTEGETVYILEKDNTFTKTRIFNDY
jgi:hypothetical protein